MTRIDRSNSPLDPLTFDSGYWLVDFLKEYGGHGFQDRNWAAYFADYGYAHAEPIPRSKRTKPSFSKFSKQQYQ
ncbi:hypothetical protein [Microcoleus sp. CAWBG58]|uniref:hypothetical protein n=1 Tax=Microcoleus sp. CAWBG58 TaxID=2841651 RepID=UPI0025EFE709|nr:hypothetical protein [Microcoleus sp. CAWBG58]